MNVHADFIGGNGRMGDIAASKKQSPFWMNGDCLTTSDEVFCFAKHEAAASQLMKR